jgi:hypothetical protein
MRTITWSALPRFRSASLPAALLATLLAGCAQVPGAPSGAAPAASAALDGLPATFESTQACCVKVTLTLRPDGAYTVRQILGPSEFYDFGRWQFSAADGLLFLEGGRDSLRYLLPAPDTLKAQDGAQGGDLKRKPAVESLRGPFRLTGLYDGTTFKECRTGLAWPVDDSRAGGSLKDDYRRSAPGMKGRPALVAIDVRFDQEGGREEVHIQRLPAILDASACP